MSRSIFDLELGAEEFGVATGISGRSGLLAQQREDALEARWSESLGVGCRSNAALHRRSAGAAASPRGDAEHPWPTAMPLPSRWPHSQREEQRRDLAATEERCDNGGMSNDTQRTTEPTSASPSAEAPFVLTDEMRDDCAASGPVVVNAKIDGTPSPTQEYSLIRDDDGSVEVFQIRAWLNREKGMLINGTKLAKGRWENGRVAVKHEDIHSDRKETDAQVAQILRALCAAVVEELTARFGPEPPAEEQPPKPDALFEY